jgi:hypothetical protein
LITNEVSLDRHGVHIESHISSFLAVETEFYLQM